MFSISVSPLIIQLVLRGFTVVVDLSRETAQRDFLKDIRKHRGEKCLSNEFVQKWDKEMVKASKANEVLLLWRGQLDTSYFEVIHSETFEPIGNLQDMLAPEDKPTRMLCQSPMTTRMLNQNAQPWKALPTPPQSGNAAAAGSVQADGRRRCSWTTPPQLGNAAAAPPGKAGTAPPQEAPGCATPLQLDPCASKSLTPPWKARPTPRQLDACTLKTKPQPPPPPPKPKPSNPPLPPPPPWKARPTPPPPKPLMPPPKPKPPQPQPPPNMQQRPNSQDHDNANEILEIDKDDIEENIAQRQRQTKRASDERDRSSKCLKTNDNRHEANTIDQSSKSSALHPSIGATTCQDKSSIAHLLPEGAASITKMLEDKEKLAKLQTPEDRFDATRQQQPNEQEELQLTVDEQVDEQEEVADFGNASEESSSAHGSLFPAVHSQDDEVDQSMQHAGPHDAHAAPPFADAATGRREGEAETLGHPDVSSMQHADPTRAAEKARPRRPEAKEKFSAKCYSMLEDILEIEEGTRDRVRHEEKSFCQEVVTQGKLRLASDIPRVPVTPITAMQGGRAGILRRCREQNACIMNSDPFQASKRRRYAVHEEHRKQVCMILHKHDASRDDWLQMSSEIDRISRVCEYFRVSTHFQRNCLPHVDYKKKMIDEKLLYGCEMHTGRKPDSNCKERIQKHTEQGIDWGKWWVTLGGFQELGAW
jgi:hypothetical protein